MISDSPPEMRRPEVDLRIRYGNGDWPGEVGERLFGDRIYPVCGPAFAAEHPVDVDGLSALPLLHVVDADQPWTTWGDWNNSQRRHRFDGPGGERQEGGT